MITEIHIAASDPRKLMKNFFNIIDNQNYI